MIQIENYNRTMETMKLLKKQPKELMSSNHKQEKFINYLPPLIFQKFKKTSKKQSKTTP